MSLGETIVRIPELTNDGPDYTFDRTGKTGVTRTAMEACHRGWDTSIHHGGCRSWQGNRHPPVPAGDGAQLAPAAFGGARGRHDVPTIVECCRGGKTQVDSIITPSIANIFVE